MIPTLLWILLSLQICLGAFDTLFHHELTERLAWRPSQKLELRLHGVRNLLYGVLFAGIGTLMVTGVLAWGVIAVLIVELGITLKDFVEEDETRRLPPSERVTHTLLALNYGAILVLLLPILVAWGKLPAGIDPQNYGLWTLLMFAAAFGVSLFGIRDLLAARRLQSMIYPDARHLFPTIARDSAQAKLRAKSYLITGGTGFIGQRLVEALVANGQHVTVLTRQMKTAQDLATPVRIITDLNQIADKERFDTLINLAGQPTAGWLWTRAYKQKLKASRVEMTRKLIGLIERPEQKPECLISGSAIGVYGIAADALVNEQTQIEDDGSFSHELCMAWETEARKAERAGVRTVLVRIGLVLDTLGGPLGQIMLPFEFGFGGRYGQGGHWISWIKRDDLVRLILTCANQPELGGAVNATAPQPVTNRDFAKAIGTALKRPAILAVPAFIFNRLLGDLGREVFLGSQRVLPTAALTAGFTFEADDIDTAFAQLFMRKDARAKFQLEPVNGQTILEPSADQGL